MDGPLDASLLEFSRVASLCNECEVEKTEDGQFKSIGAPTEAALQVAADKLMAAHEAAEEPFQAAKRFWGPRHAFPPPRDAARDTLCGSKA